MPLEWLTMHKTVPNVNSAETEKLISRRTVLENCEAKFLVTAP